MRSFKLGALPVLSFLSLFSTALSSQLISTEILYWPVSQSEPSVLAHVSYDLKTLKSDLTAYSPPSTVDLNISHDLVRVGLYIPTPTNPKQWVGTLTSRSALEGDDLHQPTLRLHLSPSKEIYHVSLVSSFASSTASTSTDSLQIEIVPDEPGPRPHLNRPVVVGPDGQNTEEVVEKTLFQKYWWVFLIITFIAMSGGGEGQ